MVSLYLAGPEVFLPQAKSIGAAKKKLCVRWGFEGIFPLDSDLPVASGEGVATQIYCANIDMIEKSVAIVANLTPFRGPSADAGTVFEIGYALGLGKAVFAYSNLRADYRSRVINACGPLAATSAGDVASDGMAVENFGLCDNLMIAQSIAAQGWNIITHAASAEAAFTDLKGFEDCLRCAREHLAG